jgi:hypothetical protein
VEPQGCDKDDELAQVMRRLAAGDEAAVVTLYERYGSSIAAAVRHVARSRPGRLDDDDVGGAVLDVCFELARVAGGWSPAGGALPWVWARHRVAGAVDRALGQQAQSLDDQRAEVLDRLTAAVAPGPSGDEPSLLDTLNRMASGDPAPRPALVDAVAMAGPGAGGPASASAATGSAPAVAAPAGGTLAVLDLTESEPAGAGDDDGDEGAAGVDLLAEALDRGGVSTRDRELLLEYAYEKHSGNTAPATAVAPLFDMREVSVRQAARRTRERLLRLAASEKRFAPLAELPLLA